MASKPTVVVLGTGGSISGLGPDRLDYVLYPEIGGRLRIEESLQRIPEVADIASIRSENLVSVGSGSVGPATWLKLANRINSIFRTETDVDGIVVTHGTATLEETAYFLHLTVKSPKPVVITGAMRPPSSMGTDADLNLYNAVQLASDPAAGGRGVLTVLNQQIHSGRDVTKGDALRPETFISPDWGPLGYVDSNHQVVFYRLPERKHTVASPFDMDSKDSLPRVDVVYAYAGADELLIDAVRNNRSDGLVLAGFGAGTFTPSLESAAKSAVEDGMSVVISTRSYKGRVVLTPRKSQYGFVASDDLMPPKARILLTLALTITADRDRIQEFFYQY
ncbi:asparaginase [SAR202 cluster bacterium AD-804-J14_MRT_500m]|nr:asparaginase [SAR202 cluster bacterium AD-804-J14_MRT_500m]